MSGFENGWIICFNPEEKGLLQGTKVHSTECIACPVHDCSAKGLLFQQWFPMWVDLDQSPLNGKIMELNRALMNRRKSSESQLYCPKKKQATTVCTAKNVFCRYNVICGRHAIRTGTSFIRSIRWRKVMIYVVMYLDGTTEVVNRNDFPEIDINRVQRVYPGSYEVKVVSELVPLGEEKEKLSETVAAFKQKYKGGVVTSDGLVNFEEWFLKASSGDSAVIPEKVLVPQKTYKIVKIKDDIQISEGKGASIVDDDEPAPVKKSAAVPQTKKKSQKIEDKQPSIFDTAVEPQLSEAKTQKGVKLKKKK